MTVDRDALGATGVVVSGVDGRDELADEAATERAERTAIDADDRHTKRRGGSDRHRSTPGRDVGGRCGGTRMGQRVR
jgi:hypothetical protein